MILLVGGAGYVGSHVARALRARGTEHLVLDNFEEGYREAIVGSASVQADLREAASVDAVFAAHPEIDSVVHFAAYISVGESVREPLKYWDNNVGGSLNLLGAMRRAGVKRLVFSSTAAVYGEPIRLPIDEEHPKAPTSPYGETKLAVERFVADAEGLFGLRSAVLRYFNAAGADPSGELGEAHRVEEHLIPLALAAARGERPPLKVFGDDWPTPDGSCVRDFVHVSDLAEAHLLALDRLREGGESCACNLGGGEGSSVLQAIAAVGEAAGQPVPVERAPRRPGDPARLVASRERAEAELGWLPRRSALATIVEDALRWHAHPRFGPNASR